MEDNDFKYILQDSGNIYIGARYSYEELLNLETVPFKLKTIMHRYLLTENDKETTLESLFYYMEEESMVYQTYDQLRVKIKVTMQREKKSLFGKNKISYGEKTLSLKELVNMNLARKKGQGLLIREIIFSKLGLMTFSV